MDDGVSTLCTNHPLRSGACGASRGAQSTARSVCTSKSTCTCTCTCTWWWGSGANTYKRAHSVSMCRKSGRRVRTDGKRTLRRRMRHDVTTALRAARSTRRASCVRIGCARRSRELYRSLLLRWSLCWMMFVVAVCVWCVVCVCVCMRGGRRG